ncbi:hypothetical protein E2C01_062870 [Portunus trituberculatus]|uniref:Uncharacterized protein n=1 Tax=Portunus trituberculatus TaxID=210409 RepID=A0A5B7HF88_PORTR|nr:hypothetical protein [Portunus trituberculatus]
MKAAAVWPHVPSTWGLSHTSLHNATIALSGRSVVSGPMSQDADTPTGQSHQPTHRPRSQPSTGGDRGEVDA